MKKEELQALIQLREYVINEYTKIEGKNNPIGQTQSMKAAQALSVIVKSLDVVLKNHVAIR